MRLLAALICTVLTTSGLPAHAQATPTTEEAKAFARVRADEGQALFDAGLYEAALTAFRDADQRFPAPTIKLMIARTLAKLGRMIHARDVYQSIIDKPLEYYAPQPFFDAQSEARQEALALASRFPTLTVHVSGPQMPGIIVAVDGKPFPRDAATELDPGAHTVAATDGGRTVAAELVVLQEGIATEVALNPTPAPPPTRVARSAPPIQAPEIQPAAREAGGLVPVVAAFSAAGAATILGVVTGVIAAGEVAHLRESCPARRCSDGPGGDAYDFGRTMSTVSTISLTVGGVLGAGGVGLLLWNRQNSTIVVAPAWAGVRGNF